MERNRQEKGKRSLAWVAFFSLVLALGAGSPVRADPAELPAGLFGSWHSTSIDGDALFLVVKSFQVDLETDGRFRAHVAFTDGQKKEFPGTWKSFPGNEMELAIKGVGKEKIHWTRTSPDTLKLSDPSFGVHFELRKGHAVKASGERWF